MIDVKKLGAKTYVPKLAPEWAKAATAKSTVLRWCRPHALPINALFRGAKSQIGSYSELSIIEAENPNQSANEGF